MEKLPSLTLADLRVTARNNGGILMSGWLADSGEPLLTPLQEMADDIARWFKPEQRWELTEVRTGYINAQRIEQSLATQRRPFDGAKVVKALGKQPDQFTPTFLFEANDPPITTIARSRSQRLKGVNVRKVFCPQWKSLVHFSDDYGNLEIGIIAGPATVSAEKIGSIYEPELALEKLSSPYYLHSVTVSPSQKQANQAMWTAHKEPEYKKDPTPLRSLTVMVFARDLGDYLHLIENKARRLHRQFNKKFPLK